MIGLTTQVTQGHEPATQLLRRASGRDATAKYASIKRTVDDEYNEIRTSVP